MPGFNVNYFKDGLIPNHTKPAFALFGILTAHNIILKNIMIHMHKITKFSYLLPISIIKTIPTNAPVIGSTHATCDDWLQKYGTTYFSNSIFFKGPLFYSDITNELNNQNITTHNCRTLNTYKNIIKSHLMRVQQSGDDENWTSDNFKLFSTPGLRKSTRTQAGKCKQINLLDLI